MRAELQERGKDFRELLEKLSIKDGDAGRLLVWLTPLFEGVESGLIVSKKYEWLSALGRDADFFDRNPESAHAEALFMSALEGWENKDWYKMLD